MASRIASRRAAPIAVALALLTAVAPLRATQAQETGEMTDDGNIVVATVNGVDITRNDLLLFIETLPQESRSLPAELLLPQIVDRLVRRKLIVAAARALDLAASEDVKQRLAFKEEEVLERAYVLKEVSDQLTEERLRSAYDQHVAELPDEEEVHARHILLETEADAAGVITELDGGADFSALAQERSKGPTASTGGDLGYFRRGDMVKGFSDAAFAMQPGSHSATPVQTEFGWHVILVEDRRRAEPPSFESLRPELQQVAAREVISEMQTRLRDAAEVTLYNLDGSPQEPEAAGEAAPEISGSEASDAEAEPQPAPQ